MYLLCLRFHIKYNIDKKNDSTLFLTLQQSEKVGQATLKQKKLSFCNSEAFIDF